ncbi:RPKL1 protein, partial [Urocolius indicus]|nr:RPKL1 protein [Urocolius indicus]
GEMLWSHLRSKYCVRRDSAESNTVQALRDCGREDGMGSSQGSSQISMSSARTGSSLPGSVTQRALGATAALPCQEQSPEPRGPESRCQLCLAPASNAGAVSSGQLLSATQAAAGGLDRVPAAPAEGLGHLPSQGLVVHPWDARSSGTGCISGRAAPQEDARLLSGPQTARGDPAGAGNPPLQQVSEVPSARPLLTPAQRQLHTGIAPSDSGNPCGPDPAAREPLQGGSLTCGQLDQQPPPGQRRALASRGHVQKAWAVKEEQVQLWAAEILLALEGLHQQGVLCRDLNPRNLLLDAAGHVRLTFFGQWTEVEPQYCSQAQEELYSAPEVGGIAEPTEAADCWSFGSLLYELLTGVPLSQNHPSGIQPHTPLHLPEGLSLAATSLLTEVRGRGDGREAGAQPGWLPHCPHLSLQLLQYNPKRRLGSGGGGMAKLKSHSFFSTVPWSRLVG